MKGKHQALVLSASPVHPLGSGPGRTLSRLCEAMKSQGVGVDILYYPADPAWRDQLPAGHMRMMREVADEVFVAPVSGAAAQASGGSSTIWDSSIGVYLDWLFQVGTYTHFFVNRAWLAQAFGHVPPAILKILYHDDNRSSDLPGGYRADEGQSAAAGAHETAILDLPDIVLASNDRERDRLAGLTHRPVLTLSPALAADDCSPSIVCEAPGVPLRVGLMAPAQADHLPVFLDFLKKLVLSVFRTMAPLSVAVQDNAGRVFPIDHPGFTGVAPVFGSIDSFHKAVDLVIVPSALGVIGGADAGLGASTALPVIALGNEKDWREETCPTRFTKSSDSLIRSCIELAFDRKAFADLRRHSALQHDQRVMQFRVLLNRVFAAPDTVSTIVVVPKAICHVHGADGNRLADIVEYLAEFGAVYIYMAEMLSAAEQKAFADLPLPGTKLLSANILRGRTENSLLSVSLASLAACVPAQLIWLACARDPDLACLAANGSNIVFDMSLLRSSAALANANIPAQRCFIAHYPGGLSWDTSRLQVAYENQMPLPFFRHLRTEMHESWHDPSLAEGLWILSDDTEWSVLREIASDASQNSCLLEATLVVGRHAELVNGPANRLLVSELSLDLRKLGRRPRACIDLCETNLDFTFVREIMLRFDVPLIPIGSLREKRQMNSMGRRDSPLRARGFGGEGHSACAPTSMIFENDAGWCRLRRLVQANTPS